MPILLWVNQGTELCSWALQANRFTYNNRNQEKRDYLLFPSICSSFPPKALINHPYSCKTNSETPLQLAALLDVSSLTRGDHGPSLVCWSCPAPPAAEGAWSSSAAPADRSSSMTETSLPPGFLGGFFHLWVGNAWQEPSSGLTVCRRVMKSPPVPLAGGRGWISEQKGELNTCWLSALR